MAGIEEGDIVVRKSYQKDVLFKVYKIINTEEGELFILKGLYCRLIADAPEADLILLTEEERDFIISQQCLNKLFYHQDNEIKKDKKITKNGNKKTLDRFEKRLL